MQPKIPPSLDARLQPHLQRVRDGTHTDDDILPAVFGLILDQQNETALELKNAVASVADEASGAARASKQQLELVHRQQHDMTLGVTNAVSSLAAEANGAAQASKQQLELVHTQQQEQEKLAVNNTLKLNSALKGIAEYHAAVDARLVAMESEITKRANIALTVQVLSLVVLIGSIVFLLLKR
jgi:hypothetical protein